MTIKTKLTEQTGVDFPLIMAPMHYVSNADMVKAAMDSGIIGTFPTLNYREEGALEKVLDQLNNHKQNTNPAGIYGVNIIVGKSNPYYEKHLKICTEKRVPFFITSLGNPKGVIEQAHQYGATVYSDVTNLEHAQKAKEMGADGFIAVGQGAGGHAGPFPLHVLIPALRKKFEQMPVVAAGAVSTGGGIYAMLAGGAAGVSMGSRFIASKESSVDAEYKQGVVDAKMQDIMMTDKITGTPSAVIYNDFAKKIGLRQNALERFFSNFKLTKKYFKMLIQYRGMKWMEKSAKPGTKDSLWMAGQSVELIDDILTCSNIVSRLKAETMQAHEDFKKVVS